MSLTDRYARNAAEAFTCPKYIPKQVGPKPADPSQPYPEPVFVRGLTDKDIASFKALGVEARITNDVIGDIWLVPEYTDQDRKEIAVEHAATLIAICAAFPGAMVASYNKIVESTKGRS